MRVLLAVLTVGILCAGLYLAIGPGDRLREKGDTLAQDSRAQSGDLQTEDASLATDGEVTEDPVIARSEGETERKGDRAAIVEADSEPATAATGMDSTGPSSVGQLPSSQLRVRGKGDSRVGSIIRGVIEDLQERGMSRATAQSGEFSSRSVDGLIRLDDGGNIQAYIYTRGTGEEARAALEALGARIEIVNEEWGIVQAWIPFDQIDGVAELELVKRIETPDYGVTEVGSVTTEGDSILRANLAREFFGFTGAGIKVGVISDGVESRASAQASGDLPATIEINPDLPGGEDDPDDEGSGDEGTALLEIIHDLAPDASLAFSGGSDGIPTSLEMVQAIDWMVKDSFNGEGADIVVDDLGFLGEPYFEDGPVAQKVKEVVANGTVYLSSAGNDSDEHYEGDFSDAGNGFHDFGGGDRTMRVTLREDGRVFLQWNDKFGSSGNDYDLYGCDEGVTPSQAAIDSGKCIASTAEQNGDDNPKERLVNTDSSDRDLDLYIKKISGSARRLEMQFIDARVREHNVSAGSVFGHKAVLGALAVGAVNADDSGHDSIAPYSSQGPSEIYFPIRETRIKPDIVAIDGVSVTGAGNFPSTFFGTSAAAPHAAAVAALVLEAIRDKDTAISKAEAAQQVSDILRDTATDLGEPGVDNMHGAGRVDAFLALTGGNELINFEQSTFSAVESLHPVVVTVLLTGALKGEILIPITLTNNGALTTDYIIDGLEGSAPNFLLRIPAKALSASFTVTAKADEEDEDGEEFILEFGTSLPPGVIAGPTAAATVNLFDKEDAPGVCGRGTQVRKAILGVIGSVAGCADVTPEDLGKVTELWLRSERIPALARIDLEGLINLEKLHLHLNELTTLHEGVFEDLTNLKLLNLAGNQLATLHAGVFDGLTNLKLLYLGANQLTELPAGLFDGLTSLKELHLASNELTAVPAGVFDGLASLEWLNLGGNQLTRMSHKLPELVL